MPSGGGLAGLDAADIRAALEELLALEAMQRSPQLGAFLTYIVEATLRGDTANLKAYSIAVDVLGRGEDFDPQEDPIVRVQARRLRGLLASFYASGRSRAAVKIELPVGRYVPEFTTVPGKGGNGKARPTVTSQIETGRASPNNVWLIGLLAVGVLATALAFWPSLSMRTYAENSGSQPLMPFVIVEEFQNLASDELGSPLVAGLALEIVTDINQFHDMAARYGGFQASLQSTEVEGESPTYIVSGVVRRVIGGLQYGALVSSGTSEATVMTIDIMVPVENGQPSLSLDDVSRRIVLQIASPRSPLHAPARSWLSGELGIGALALYPCLVVFGLYQEARLEHDMALAETCATDLVPAYPGVSQAMLAAIGIDRAWQAGFQSEEGMERVVRANALADAASEHDPMSGFVWALKARVSTAQGDLIAARDRFNASLQMNPASVDMLAAYSTIMARIGNWPSATRLYAEVEASEARPPEWYYITPALYSLRNGEYRDAIRYGRRVKVLYPDFGAAILVAAAGAIRDTETVNEQLSRLLASQAYRRVGILPALRYQITDPELMRQFASGLSLAGVPIDRLSRPF